MDGIREAYFAVMDEVRRAQADALAACGLGSIECDYRVLASGPHWCLRSYAPAGGWASVFIVAAPIKRPYIWDIDPDVSVIRYCLGQQLRVYLIEWKAATLGHEAIGLDEYADLAISECLAKIADHARGQKPFLMGHSFGGTLAAIHAACAFRRSRPGIPSEGGHPFQLKPAGDSDDPGHLLGIALVSAFASVHSTVSASSF